RMTAEMLAGREEMRNEIQYQIQHLKTTAANRNREFEETSLRLGRMERYVRQSAGARQTLEKSGERIAMKAPAGSAAADPEAAPEGPGLDYFRLESRYRPPSLLRERQRSYLKYFTGCHNVLDIGCGRGEFVQLLIQEGIGACGVDLDADTSAHAQEQGLPVQQADALAYLEELPNASLDGVFMAQVVEHLTPSYLVSMLELCYRKMKPDAPLVAETINPVCLWALTNWYLIDPTHVRPVHPDTLKFALESTGFWHTEVQYLSPVPERDRLAELADGGKLGDELRGMAKHINKNIRQLNEFLYGFQEYVVIAKRIPDEPEPDSAARDRQEEA
ncbi:MAG: class I SAM-dependent methyltransferase, partial [Anaerolineae bacterium]|nr:class I SAM-dependent methyltransferase [Anaerolineae bacterium]